MSGPLPRPPQEPVDLSGTKTDHGKAAAYNVYKCRCGLCQNWRRSYDRDRWEWAQRQKQRTERKT